MTIILSYIFYFITASASPLQRRWIAKVKNTENKGQTYFAFQTALIVAVLSCFLPLFAPIKVVGESSLIFLLTVSTGILSAFFYIFSYTAQKHVEAGVSSLVSNVNTPITILFSTIFLGEALNLYQIFGTILLLLSIFIVSKKHQIGKFHFDKYFLLMLLSGIFLAFVLVVDRALVKNAGLILGTMLSFWSTCIFLGMIVLFDKNRHEYNKKDVLITGVLRFFQNVSWFVLVYVVGNLSIVSSVSTFKIFIIFLAAALFLHEREDWQRKLFGSIIAVVGLLLMK